MKASPVTNNQNCDGVAAEMSGSATSWAGIIYAPRGRVKLNGSSNTTILGSVIADAVGVSGSVLNIDSRGLGAGSLKLVLVEWPRLGPTEVRTASVCPARVPAAIRKIEPGGSVDAGAETLTESTPWKAGLDVYSLTAPTERVITAMKSHAADLELSSADPACRFYPQVRVVDSPHGRAVVVSDIAEYVESGAKKSAVVVSGVVEATDDGGRRLVIRTHLEDQHTRHDGDAIVFDEHHDAIRAAFVAAIEEVDPEATRVRRPQPPARRAAARRAASVVDSETDQVAESAGPDLSSLLGMALLGVGVILLLMAVASGSFGLILVALGLTLALGWAGTRIQRL